MEAIGQMPTVGKAMHIESIVIGMGLEEKPEVAEMIAKKYRARGLLHTSFGEQYPVTIIPIVDFGLDPKSGDITMGGQRQYGMLKMADWYSRNLQAQYIFEDQERNVVSHKVIDLPYFSSMFAGQEMNDMHDYVGPEANQAALAKDKNIFNKEAMLIGNNKDPYENFAIPHQHFIHSWDEESLVNNRAIVINRLCETRRMYDEIQTAAKEIYGDDSKIVEVLSRAKAGLVLRPASRDGGFGNVFIRELDNDKWEVKIDGVAQEITGNSYLGSIEQATNYLLNKLGDGLDYVVTRMVDVEATPSIGVRFGLEGEEVEPRFRIMDITEQIQDDTNTTVGGGSMNVASNGISGTIKIKNLNGSGETIDSFIKRHTNDLVHHFFNPEDQKQYGHMGFDWLVAGEIDREIMWVLKDNPELMQKYGVEFAQAFSVECNPRDTLISGPAMTLARAIKISRGDESIAVVAEDIDSLYDGRAGFWVHDFVEIPEEWVKEGQSNPAIIITRIGEKVVKKESSIVKMTEKLLEYITNFNNQFQGKVVMTPRVDVYEKEPGKFVCSVAMASVCGRDNIGNLVENPDNNDLLSEILHTHMNQGDGHYAIPEIDFMMVA